MRDLVFEKMLKVKKKLLQVKQLLKIKLLSHFARKICRWNIFKFTERIFHIYCRSKDIVDFHKLGQVRAAKDHGEKFWSKLAASFSGIAHC